MRYSGKITLTIILMLFILCSHHVNADPDQVGEPVPGNDTVWNVDVGTGTLSTEAPQQENTEESSGLPLAAIIAIIAGAVLLI
ncbi:MAG: hypothetical protein K6F99_07585, partial [Lachnospiraceae bacterium]|nr:hypothetical protein [Lachnospiraceae bacterium]